MKKALIDTRDNMVIQVEATEFAVGDPYAWVNCPDEVEAYQWTYDGSTFAPPPPPPPAPIPSKVSMYQARTALSRAGLLATVEAALASMPDQAGEEARIKWEFAVDVRREDALVSVMASILNLDSAGLDSLFTTASEII